jgi:hypothetical protein
MSGRRILLLEQDIALMSMLNQLELVSIQREIGTRLIPSTVVELYLLTSRRTNIDLQKELNTPMIIMDPSIAKMDHLIEIKIHQGERMEAITAHQNMATEKDPKSMTLTAKAAHQDGDQMKEEMRVIMTHQGEANMTEGEKMKSILMIVKCL